MATSFLRQQPKAFAGFGLLSLLRTQVPLDFLGHPAIIQVSDVVDLGTMA